MADKKKKVADKKENTTKLENTSTKKETVKKKSSVKSKTNSSKKTVSAKSSSRSKKEVKIASSKDKKDLVDMNLTPKTNNTKAVKAKEKAVAKSRQANKKEVNARKKKREETRIIPVDKILEAQRKAELEAAKQAKNKQKQQEKAASKKLADNSKKDKKIKVAKKKNKKSDTKVKKIRKIRFNGKSISSLLVSDKMRKIYIGIVIFCIVVLLLEGIYFLIIRDRLHPRSTYYDSLNSLTLDNTDIVAVGSSNFKNSKYNDYPDGLEKAKLVKYDKSGNIIFEKMYDKGINSTFNAVVEVEDGYIAVGSYEKDKNQSNDGLRDALIVKYDKDGKIIWEKDFTSLSNSKFNKVVEVEDGYIVIGQSIYADMEMGNATEGGGVIIKYSKDGEIIWKSFHGGTKSASFNGIVVVDSNFYVVGRDGTDFGNIVKYSSNGEYQWHKNYRYTDTFGLSDIVYSNGKLYVVGSKEMFDHEVTDDDKRNTTNTDALLIRYNLDGDIEFEKTFGGSSYERYNSIMAYHNNLFAIGSSSSSDSGLKIFTDGEKTAGILVKYDLDGNIERKNVYGGSNQDNLTDIVTDNSNLYITAYTNSRDGNIIVGKDNGKDYYGRLIKVDSRLRVLFLK